GNHDDNERQGKCQHVKERRFHQELSNQLRAEPTHNFTQAHFAGTFHRSGSCKVNVVYPRDENYKNGDHAKEIRSTSATVDFEFAHVVGIKVNVIHPLQVKCHAGI